MRTDKQAYGFPRITLRIQRSLETCKPRKSQDSLLFAITLLSQAIETRRFVSRASSLSYVNRCPSSEDDTRSSSRNVVFMFLLKYRKIDGSPLRPRNPEKLIVG
jgi:hypothetical protein